MVTITVMLEEDRLQNIRELARKFNIVPAAKLVGALEGKA
jgi:hypothetical protein